MAICKTFLTFAPEDINRLQNETMTTLTLHIDNPAIIPSLRKVLSALEGVTIARPTRTKAETPNKTTVKAINEAKQGKTFKASSVDDLLSQCLG